MQTEKQRISTADYARLLGVSLRTFRRYLAAGKLPMPHFVPGTKGHWYNMDEIRKEDGRCDA